MKNTKKEYSIKRSITSIINAIAEEEDANLIDIYENKMVSMYASVLLFIASLVNFVVRHYIRSEDFEICLFTSLVFLLLGISFDVISRINLKGNIMTLGISVLSFITLIFICTNYYDIIGPAVWTVAFIQVLLAMMRVTKMMLYFLISAIIISNIYILYHSYNSPLFQMDIIDIVQIVLFVILFIIADTVHKINLARYNKVKNQYQEEKKKEEEITDLYEKLVISEEKNKHLAYHDSLTGLPNRLLLSEQLNYAIHLSGPMKKFIAIVFLDLDNFKIVNDSMGHDIGDQLLVEVSKRLVTALGECDTVARIGGDEFIILIESAEDINSIIDVLEKILNSFLQSYVLNNQAFFITPSLGVSIYPADGQDAETLIKNADMAMYKAKANGGNQYAFCTQGMKNKVINNIKLNNNLYRALECNEFELYYQPQVNSSSGKIIGLEALLRWNSPELGMVFPGSFIPVAEKTGLIIPIGEWVLRTACKQNKAWQDAGLSKIPVAVNLSVRQFRDQNIIYLVKEILSETGLDSNYLELEITESVVMKEISSIVETLNAFKNMGITISIDDFGTEYSSMNYLKELPVDKIKIALPFIQGIGVSDKDEAITRAIIVMAENMGLSVIAEGVETKNQLTFLTMNLCEKIQGFYFFKPMPANEVEKLLKNN
jgi:diguanylate cyclase (GGDEF)-like protein